MARFYQVLHVELKFLEPSTFKGGDDDDENPCLFQVAVQEFDQWGLVDSHPTRLGEEVNAFVFEQTPCTVDVLRLCGCNPTNRTMFMEWQVDESDVQGCVRLHSPQVLRPKMSLSSASVPCLMLMDVLMARGWAQHQGPCRHGPDAEKRFDCRKAYAKRCYLQCIICCEEVFGAGVAEFSSTHNSTWYAYLLRFNAVPPAGLSAKDMKVRIAGGADQLALPAALAMPGPAPLPLPPLAPVDPDIAGDDEPCEEEEPAVAPAVLVAPAVEYDAIAGDEPVAAVDWPARILGQTVSVIKGRHVGGYSYYDRLAVQCCNPEHVGCSRSRSTALLVAEFGPKACEYWLGAWLSSSHVAQGVHRGLEPTRAEIAAFRDSL